MHKDQRLMSVALAASFALGLHMNNANADQYEPTPLFRAADVLGHEAVVGENYRIEEAVSNDGIQNLFTVVSPDITLTPLGNEMALERGREMQAIAAIRKVKKTDAYVDGLEAAIAGPLASAKEAITHPVETIKAVPGAISRLVGDISAAVSNMGKDDGDREDNQMFKDLIGYNQTKRRLARDLNVDVYSTNPVLQEELDDLAWASFAGDATINIAVAVTTTGVGVVTGTLELATASDDLIFEKSASTLANISRRHLIDMGLDENQSNSFLSTMTYSVSQQTRLVQALAVLQEVPGRNVYITLAEGATDENSARYHRRTAEIIGSYHQQIKPVARLKFDGDVAYFVTVDGQTIQPLVADYVAWTEKTATRMAGLISATGNRSLLLTGRVSSATRRHLQSSGIDIQELAFSQMADRIAVVKIDDLEPAPDQAEKQPAQEETESGGLTGMVKSVGSFFTKAGADGKE